MKKDRDTASQKYDTQSRARRFNMSWEGKGGEGLKNVEILSPVHQLRRSQKVTPAASANWSQIWSERGGKPSSGGIAQVGISIHVQGSVGSVTFFTMMKTHWCGWARISGTSSAVVTGRCRTNKEEQSLMYFWFPRHPHQYWICINWFSSPFRARLRQKLITVRHMRDICISSYVPLRFSFIVGSRLTGLNQISRALMGFPLLLSGCPIPLFITSFCGCFE